MFADFGFPIDDFFVGQHGAESRAPPDGLVFNVSQSALEKLEPDPLGPFEIFRVGRINLTTEIIRDPDCFQLSGESGDIFLGHLDRMAPCLYRVIFGRKPKGIPSDGIEHIESLGAFVSGHDVWDHVVLTVPEMETGT